MARISKAVQEINSLLQPEGLASFVVNKYVGWRSNRLDWVASMKELRNYVFQTDTTQTTNKQLPWKNKTSIPKICQIRDNLHANYFAALFPSDDWFKWDAAAKDAVSADTAIKIEGYMKQKIRESGFKETISALLYDYIDTGNAFGEVSYISETHTLKDGTSIGVYTGPKAHRISPYDIYFDLSASNFADAGKVTRSVVSMGTLKKAATESPEFAWVTGGIEQSLALRGSMQAYGGSDIDKAEGIMVDGFGSLSAYYSSDMVELLEYEGDTFDSETKEIKSNRRIIVMDRKTVVYDEPMESWLGKTNKEHAGWRPRPDNLLAMGPLDNLVGMQYRIDHLENLKADVFDQIAHPVIYQRGVVEDWNWEPGARIYGDVDSDVRVLAPDTTALNADFQIQNMMQMMEELVGAPKQAMGIRTPGEKTAFEVQALENNAGRIFQHKIQQFEMGIVEPLLNQMLESARRNLTAAEIVKVLDEDAGVALFMTIQPKDINSRGKLFPVGARHFAKQAQTVQNLLGFINSAAYQDPAVAAHVSGVKIAKLMEENLGLERFDLVTENIRVAEVQETQKLGTQAQENVASDVMDRNQVDELQ